MEVYGYNVRNCVKSSGYMNTLAWYCMKIRLRLKNRHPVHFKRILNMFLERCLIHKQPHFTGFFRQSNSIITLRPVLLCTLFKGIFIHCVGYHLFTPYHPTSDPLAVLAYPFRGSWDGEGAEIHTHSPLLTFL